MRQDIAEKWAEALESGLYDQAKGVLHTVKEGKDRFCCLGVLCRMAYRDGVGIHAEVREDYYLREACGGC